MTRAAQLSIRALAIICATLATGTVLQWPGARAQGAYTCGGPATVEVPDEALAAALRASLGIEATAPITCEDMAKLRTFELNRADVGDLTGLEAAVNLERLDLRHNEISDLEPL